VLGQYRQREEETYYYLSPDIDFPADQEKYYAQIEETRQRVRKANELRPTEDRRQGDENACGKQAREAP